MILASSAVTFSSIVDGVFAARPRDCAICDARCHRSLIRFECYKSFEVMVGAARFELATPCAQGMLFGYSTMFVSVRGVRYTAMESSTYLQSPKNVSRGEQTRITPEFPYFL